MNRRSWVCWVAVVLGGACAADDKPYEGETHWLGGCTDDSECGRGQCLCGVCTRPCAGDRDCEAGGILAYCYDSASPGLADECGMDPPSAVCLARCDADLECPEDTTCGGGACTAMPRSPAGFSGDSGTDAGGSPPQASDHLGDMVEPVDFGEPLAVPEPARTIHGDAAQLEGVWWALGEDGTTPCSDENGPVVQHPVLHCARLDVTRAAGGDLAATITWTPTPGGAFEGPVGPFAPPTDARVAYPSGLDIAGYAALQLSRLTANVPYRLLDGAFDGELLRGWFSGLELWSDWCALQQAVAVSVEGTTRYRCDDPLDASSGDMHRALCTDQWDYGQCPTDDPPGGTAPCTCLETSDSARAQCTEAVCTCDAQGCSANLRGWNATFTATLGDDVLVAMVPVGAYAWQITFRRSN